MTSPDISAALYLDALKKIKEALESGRSDGSQIALEIAADALADEEEV